MNIYYDSITLDNQFLQRETGIQVNDIGFARERWSLDNTDRQLIEKTRSIKNLEQELAAWRKDPFSEKINRSFLPALACIVGTVALIVFAALRPGIFLTAFRMALVARGDAAAFVAIPVMVQIIFNVGYIMGALIGLPTLAVDFLYMFTGS